MLTFGYLDVWMAKMISSYLSLSGVTTSPSLVEQALAELDAFLNSEQGTANAVWSYLIPELGEGGSCSLFGQLQDAPFELESYINNNQENNVLLEKLNAIVQFVVDKTQVDWFGIYANTLTPEGEQLLKLAYHGAPSRPLFPLTEDFAKISNNVQVALSSKGRVVNDVAEYVAQGGEYYTCDPKVQSEACLPMFDNISGCTGIIDAEAFTTGIFDEQVLAVLVAACIRIPQYLPRS